MGLTQQVLLQELLAPRRDTWTPSFPMVMNKFFSYAPFDDQSPEIAVSNPSLLGLLSSSADSKFTCPYSNEIYPLLDGLPILENDMARVQIQGDHPSMGEDGEIEPINSDIYSLEVNEDSCTVDEMKAMEHKIMISSEKA